MQTITIIVNNSPYGGENTYNALRTVMTLQKRENVKVNLFLFADATYCALPGQTTPDGYYNIERMFRGIARKGKIGACGTCMKARGLAGQKLVEGVNSSSMEELADWILASDKILTF
jgi:uncharacterized protein involved in oxidation of intracellular sulfur